MRVFEYKDLLKSADEKRKRQEDWLLTVRQFQVDAVSELWSSYRLLCEEDSSSKRPHVERILFRTPALVLGSADEAYIYVRPADGVLCYGVNQTEWNVNDPRLWPTSRMLQPVASSCPPDVWRLLFSHLSVADIFAIGCTCQLLRTMTRNDVVWMARKRELLAMNPHAGWCFPDKQPLWRCFVDICSRRRVSLRQWRSTNMSKRDLAWACLSLELSFPFDTARAVQYDSVAPDWVPRDEKSPIKYTLGRVNLCLAFHRKSKTMHLYMRNGLFAWNSFTLYVHNLRQPFELLWMCTGPMRDYIVSKSFYSKSATYQCLVRK